PTMFEPVHLARPGADQRVLLVDGGVFANNPSLLAFAELTRTFAGKDDRFLVVSLGTGQAMERMKRKRLSDWGYVRWSKPMIELVSESGSEALHEQMQSLLPATDYQRYYRFQVDLPDDVYYALDNPAKGNMAGLINAAEELMADPETEEEMSTLCELLTSGQQQFDDQRERINQYNRAMVAVQLVSEARNRRSRAGNATTIRTDRVQARKDAEGGSTVTGQRPRKFESVARLQLENCKVVLCYAGEDLGVVRPLADALAQRGIAPSFERFDLQPRENIRHLLRHATGKLL